MDRPPPPIEDYALLGNCHGAALVSKSGSIDWACPHRMDHASVFGRLLDAARGGYFRVAPRGHAEVERRYRERTNVLETRFITERGVLLVVDALIISDQSVEDVTAPPSRLRPLKPEEPDPPTQLARRILCEEGVIEAEVHLEPRFDYGLTVPGLRKSEDGLWIVFGGSNALLVETDLELRCTGEGQLRAVRELRQGQRAYVSVKAVNPHGYVHEVFGAAGVDRWIDHTTRWWRAWCDRTVYDGGHEHQVIRSALVLKALTNEPTGALVAAPTTSLPESLGGARNWDYRYTWIRDAHLQLQALHRIGHHAEADAFMRWLRIATAGRPEDLQVMYGLGGERLLPEFEVPSLRGYAGSFPVRVGNDAYRQRQLDVFGHLVGTACIHHDQGGETDEVFWTFLRGCVDCVRRLYREPDHGTWEVRHAPKHFVSSKIMAWVAVDRALRVAGGAGRDADVEAWRQLADDLRRLILSEGVSPKDGALGRSFDDVEEPDAATLLAPLMGFLPPRDPRVLATLRRVEERLTDDGLVYRYRAADDLPGGEGAFVITSFWLVMARALAGDVEEAEAHFERLLGRANDVGLYGEQIEPSTGRHLGNFPQAFSHLGLVSAAALLADVRRESHRGRPEMPPREAA